MTFRNQFIPNQVLQRPGDPNIYLNVKGEWYYYNPNSTPLGDGAMGTVYLGFSCNSSKRIAVKRVKDAYANNPMIRARARQEASLTISHKNLVQMIGLCEVHPTSGPIFILSGYVPGITLGNHVKSQLCNLPEDERINKIVGEIGSVLSALDCLHSRGIVHRDIKPSNIMLENESIVKLMDLGIARMNGGNQYSSFGFIGTPQYSAPEQILRDSQNNTEVTAQTDIYAVGVTLYELICGENPYKCESETEMLTRQVTMRLPFNKKIPLTLFNVISKSTEKEPSKRYKSAMDFKRALEDAIKPTLKNRLLNYIGRNKILVCLILLVAVLIMIIGVFL